MSSVEPFQMLSAVLASSQPWGTGTPDGSDGPLTPIQGRNIAISKATAPTAAIICPRDNLPSHVRPPLVAILRSAARTLYRTTNVNTAAAHRLPASATTERPDIPAATCFCCRARARRLLAGAGFFAALASRSRPRDFFVFAELLRGSSSSRRRALRSSVGADPSASALLPEPPPEAAPAWPRRRWPKPRATAAGDGDQQLEAVLTERHQRAGGDRARRSQAEEDADLQRRRAREHPPEDQQDGERAQQDGGRAAAHRDVHPLPRRRQVGERHARRRRRG